MPPRSSVHRSTVVPDRRRKAAGRGQRRGGDTSDAEPRARYQRFGALEKTTAEERRTSVGGLYPSEDDRGGRDMSNCEIVSYEGGRNDDIVAFILDVQRNDVGLIVPVEEQYGLADIAHAYRHGGFWLAVSERDIVGTIGMMRCGSVGILKKLFVHRDHRGPTGAAHALYERAVEWATAHDLVAVLLDTPAIATRSHAFYRRKGFRPVEKTALPEGYRFADHGSLILRLDLTTGH
ncbi:MAG: GNAT family N-acetyltransferase [Alphaproteobacteria bacterium]|nr:MAG: GNAT family N-acetyltransferase [Alphaproteobacteria bacterium]